MCHLQMISYMTIKQLTYIISLLVELYLIVFVLQSSRWCAIKCWINWHSWWVKQLNYLRWRSYSQCLCELLIHIIISYRRIYNVCISDLISCLIFFVWPSFSCDWFYLVKLSSISLKLFSFKREQWASNKLYYRNR